jgi:large subunit ribosomal protein L20
MPRVKRGNKRRGKRKKLLSLAKGYFLNKGKLYRAAQQAVDRAGNFAYVGRRNKKRDFRRLWILRINAAARQHDLNYSQLIAGLKQAGVGLDRKSLADLAATDPAAFGRLVESAKAARASA